jgi:acetoin utilization protein AcuB
MLVKYWMKKDPAVIDVSDSMYRAINVMKEKEASMLPVIKKGKLTGILTDRDIKRASASDATSLDIHELIYLLSRIQVGDIMSKNPITVPSDYTIEETAAVLLKNNISGVPVLEGDQIVGVITQRDLFRALISLSGLEKRGVQFAFQVEDKTGTIKEVTDLIRNYGGRLVSILSSYERAPMGYRNVYIRAYGISREVMPKLLAELKEKALIMYVVDHKEERREVFGESI